MDAGRAAGLLRWLEGEPADVADLAAQVAVTAVQRHGTTVCYGDHARRRRLLEFDRHETLLAALRWHDTTLAEARVRLPDRSWLLIEPHADFGASWGFSDRLWHADSIGAGGEALTLFEALDWANVDRIPTLAEPARLPAGAGATALNVIAALAGDQGRSVLRYSGPYPTEQLFITLLESFRYDPTTADPLAAFERGELDWHPAPHERVFTREGACVHLRERVEKVVWRAHAYHRPDVQGVGRYAPYRVRDVAGHVVCSLWALGTAVEDTLTLTNEGDVVGIVESLPPPPERGPIAGEVADGIGAIVAAVSAPPLAAAIRAAAHRLTLTWAPLHGELANVNGDTVCVSSRLRARLAVSLESSSDDARRDVALAMLTEVALLLGDVLRARAQASVAELSEPEQRALLETPAPDADTARAITAAVAALAARA
ncbi:MAG: hypothetical protein DMD91_22040 [Candidatus Rokuibacteriota bacterium]|nr:MAG: hypothetical protein DMD91_22040 [Candidatus Rokubacteria bacterium]